MTLLAFSEYAPDISPFGEQDSNLVTNVFARKDGYGPVPASTAFSAALPAACRGYFKALNADGSITLFAATSTRLWRMSNTNATWIPVSKVSALTSISNGTPALFTLVSHGLSIGDAIVLSTSAADLPAPLAVGTVYYVIAAGFTANAFEVSLTVGGAAINTTTAGSGTHSFTAQYASIPTTDQWQFVQFNNFVLATQLNIVVQVYDLTISTAFADLAGSPPQARYIAVVNRFLVLSGLGSSTPYRIQWSGLNATTTWTSGVNSSDFQDLPDGGVVRTVAGGEQGIIFQDNAIRRMIFAPGNPIIFQIERVSQDKGIFAPLSIVRAGDRVFFAANDGFHFIPPGGYPTPVGKERVDRKFFAEVDTASFQFCLGASDPKASRVYFTYKSLSSSSSLFDTVLCYDFVLDRWTLITGWPGEYIAASSQPGLSLDGLDSISGSIDALTTSLDNFSTVALGQLSIADSSHKIAFISGSNLEATVDTSEQELPTTRRLRIKGVRPITDAATCYGSLGTRENIQSTVVYSTEQLVNGKGLCPANTSTRMARARLRVPSATNWSFASGFEPDFAQEGKR